MVDLLPLVISFEKGLVQFLSDVWRRSFLAGCYALLISPKLLGLSILFPKFVKLLHGTAITNVVPKGAAHLAVFTQHYLLSLLGETGSEAHDEVLWSVGHGSSEDGCHDHLLILSAACVDVSTHRFLDQRPDFVRAGLFARETLDGVHPVIDGHRFGPHGKGAGGEELLVVNLVHVPDILSGDRFFLGRHF